MEKLCAFAKILNTNKHKVRHKELILLWHNSVFTVKFGLKTLLGLNLIAKNIKKVFTFLCYCDIIDRLNQYGIFSAARHAKV